MIVERIVRDGEEYFVPVAPGTPGSETLPAAVSECPQNEPAPQYKRIVNTACPLSDLDPIFILTN